MKNKLSWRVSKSEGGMRLLQFLREKDTGAPSVKAIKRAIDGKQCTVNRRIETFSSYELQEGDLVALSLETCEEKTHKIAVLFEDKELLVINKPAGLICDPKSIQAALKNRVHLVHRLDKETSGVLILAKTPEAKKALTEQFKKRTISKLYLALVEGIPSKEEGTIDNFLGRKFSYEGQTTYGSVEEKKGQRAITHYKCLKKGKTASVICCEPYTGRTHQLRAHLSGIGHPILGDVQYGKKFLCPHHPSRNLLHAYSVRFPHPKTGKEIKVVAPIPLDFRKALDELKISLNEEG